MILSDEAVYKEDRRGATVTPRISYEDVSTFIMQWTLLF